MRTTDGMSLSLFISFRLADLTLSLTLVEIQTRILPNPLENMFSCYQKPIRSYLQGVSYHLASSQSDYFPHPTLHHFLTFQPASSGTELQFTYVSTTESSTV